MLRAMHYTDGIADVDASVGPLHRIGQYLVHALGGSLVTATENSQNPQ